MPIQSDDRNTWLLLSPYQCIAQLWGKQEARTMTGRREGGSSSRIFSGCLFSLSKPLDALASQWLQHPINTIVAGVTYTPLPVPKTPASWGTDLCKCEGSSTTKTHKPSTSD